MLSVTQITTEAYKQYNLPYTTNMLKQMNDEAASGGLWLDLCKETRMGGQEIAEEKTAHAAS